jgi:predicted dehydrogenase
VFVDPYESITVSDLDAVVVALPDDLHHSVG